MGSWLRIVVLASGVAGDAVVIRAVWTVAWMRRLLPGVTLHLVKHFLCILGRILAAAYGSLSPKLPHRSQER